MESNGVVLGLPRARRKLALSWIEKGSRRFKLRKLFNLKMLLHLLSSIDTIDTYYNTIFYSGLKNCKVYGLLRQYNR